MTRFLRVALAATLAFAMTTTPGTVTDPESTPVEQVQGTGRRGMRLACVGCAVGFIAISGTGSIAALAFAIGGSPEIAVACIIACDQGF